MRTMKRMIFSLLFVVGFSSAIMAQKYDVNWEKKYGKAVETARKQNKPILIFFTGSDWCGPCKMLVEDFFESKRFGKLARENFVVYKADFPKNRYLVTLSQHKKNDYLSRMYGVNSYPTIVVIDKEGKELGRKSGYNLMRDTRYHFIFLKDILKYI
jgi:thioredoxin-related protein